MFIQQRLFLAVAIVSGVMGASRLKAVAGFTRFSPSLLVRFIPDDGEQ
ncbi:MAG: hypothetical protein K0A94_12550 [Desulfuromonadales bacterium]|nr:hypothetical protein [Desulfuromonadales bacterium]